MDRLQKIFMMGQIEFYWWLIRLYRKRGNRLITTGCPLASERLHRIARRIEKLGFLAQRCEVCFEEGRMYYDKNES